MKFYVRAALAAVALWSSASAVSAQDEAAARAAQADVQEAFGEADVGFTWWNAGNEPRGAFTVTPRAQMTGATPSRDDACSVRLSYSLDGRETNNEVTFSSVTRVTRSGSSVAIFSNFNGADGGPSTIVAEGFGFKSDGTAARAADAMERLRQACGGGSSSKG